MEATQFRPLSELERRVLDKLISVISPGGEVLKKQVESAQVKEIDTLGSLEFLVSSTDKYLDATGPLVTAQQEDVDTVPGRGPYINFLLFLRDGTIEQLEIYKDDASPIRSVNNPEKFTLTWGLPPKTRGSMQGRDRS